MAACLSKEGFDVVLAADGRRVSCWPRSFVPRPSRSTSSCRASDGWSVLAALKSDPELSDIPVVMVTMTDDRRMGYALGACDYLTKPVDPAGWRAS